MHIIRSRFYKKEDMIFISHLDLVRLFERAMRRANIPISYTQGFNPHPIMSFATALGVGISSEGEYIDIQLDEPIAINDFKERINKVLPKGLGIIESKYISKKEPSLMSVIRYSVYVVKVPFYTQVDPTLVPETLKKFMGLDKIIEIKEKNKKHNRRDKEKEIQEINIRTSIYDISILKEKEKEIILKMTLAAGSIANLKPETVIRKFKEISGLPIDLDKVRIHRLELLKEQEGQPLTPLSGLLNI